MWRNYIKEIAFKWRLTGQTKDMDPENTKWDPTKRDEVGTHDNICVSW